jgi:hypothetical protein
VAKDRRSERESREGSRLVIDMKQVGIMWISHVLPRNVREVRVHLSRARNFLFTRESEFQVRVSETNVKWLTKSHSTDR